MSGSQSYRTSPDQAATGWPPGVPYIVGNEVCERFSFYGMRAILNGHLVSLFAVVLTVQGVLGDRDAIDGAAKLAATNITHLFFAGVYASPLIGAIIADRLLGKYRTILYLSLVYCLGHAVLSLFDHELMGMYVGLALIAIGSGGIKPCVSANVGDQFGKGNWHLVRIVYQIFYFSINFGSFFATLLIPVIKRHYGPSVAFAVPGILMFVATFIFWLGRHQFVHVPPKPGGTVGVLDTLSSIALFMSLAHFFFSPGLLAQQEPWVRYVVLTGLTLGFLALGLWLFQQRQRLEPDDGFLAITLYALGAFVRGRGRPVAGEEPLGQSRFWGPAVERFGAATEGPVAVFKIMSVFFFVCIFWALYDQKPTTWRNQALAMDLSIWPGSEHTLTADQTIAVNPFLIMLLIPLLSWIYRRLEPLGIKVKPLPLMTIGMFFAAASFAVTAEVQRLIDNAPPKSIWVGVQLIQYVLLTIAEAMVSVTGLEFAYTQAPKRMKSTVMGFWLLTSSVGNVLVVFLEDVRRQGAAYSFWVYAVMMAGAGVLFGVRAYFYEAKDYTQG